MQKHAQPMSPRTQAFQMQPGPDEEGKIFEDGFSQMAYNVLVSKFPDLIQNVITFKILDTDIESGAGVGAFVVQQDSDVIYVPIVMADNQIKPVDLFYHKGLNIFLPLNNDWLDEVSQLTLNEMGEEVQRPKSLQRDVDTRNIMIPPTTGRYAYAAATSGPLDIEEDLLQILKKVQEKTASYKPVLLNFLTKAPETVKEAFYQTLKQHPRLAAQAARLYGLEPLATSLETIKTAAATNADPNALNVIDNTTPANKVKDVFGDRAAEAFQGVLHKGYAAKDNRKGLNSAVQIQEKLDLTTPQESGFYRVFTRDGDVKNVFVLHNPRKFTDGGWGRPGPELGKGRRNDALHHGQHNKDFLVVMDKGTYVQTNSLVAQPREEGNDAAAFGKLMLGENGDTPRAGNRGIFVKKLGKTFVGTAPFKIKSIATDAKGIRRITCDDFVGTKLITDPAAAKAGLHQPKNEPMAYIPPDARFLRLGDSQSGMDLLDKTSAPRWFKQQFDAMGASTLSVKDAGARQFSIDGSYQTVSKVEAMKTAALKGNIPFSEAEHLVKEAEVHGKARAYILTPPMMEKIAQTPMMGAAPQGGAPMGPAMQDPSMMGGAPMGAPPAPPSPPSPLDIAMGEAQTQIQQQSADLQQQNIALQDKAQTLMMVQQRAQEIAGGGAQVVGAGAPPMPPPGMQGAPQGAPQSGMMPGPAGQVSGGMAGVMPGMGQEMLPPTGAAMSTEAPSSMEIQQQVNPQFLEAAGGLDDAQAFDAAAIASMAQAPSFRDMVVDYVPTLERALDNLGRVMLSMWMQERELKEQIGDEDYADLEDNLRIVFEGLGKLILEMNRNAIIMSQQPGLPA